MRRIYGLIAPLVLAGLIPALVPQAHALEKQPAATYRARRVALAQKLNGGVAVLFAAEEPLLDLDPYRQDEDFYYATGWNEPGAALLVVGDSTASAINSTLFPEAGHKYEEILFLPTRNMRMEKYTGIKLDAATAGAAAKVGVDEVRPMTDLPKVLNDLISADRRVANHIYTQAGNAHASALVQFAAAEVGASSLPAAHDVAEATTELREVKDAGEIDLLKKASEASEAAQRAIASPLLEAGAIDGARGILINITGSASLKLAEVQQACTIIQSAAHEDANIIFGAVMDEKMKDAVKITVIATGFRTAQPTRHRHQETRTSFAARNDDAMDFPSREPADEPTPGHIMSSADPAHSEVSAADDRSPDDRSFDESFASAANTSALTYSSHVSPSIPVDPMHTSVANYERTNYEQDDLDVPAFLRKRSEVM